MKNLIKNASLIGLLLLGVACKGPEGGPGMKMTSCDVNKEEVKEILTGKSQNCSGIVRSAITTQEAKEILQDTFLTSDGTVVTIKEETFWSIFEIGGKQIALRGTIQLEEDNVDGDETLTIQTFLGNATMMNGLITFGDDITISITRNEKTETTSMEAYQVDSSLELQDEDIIIVTNEDEFLKAILSL